MLCDTNLEASAIAAEGRLGTILGCPWRDVFPFGRHIVFMIRISKSSEFASVGSAVEVGFYYRGLACIRMNF